MDRRLLFPLFSLFTEACTTILSCTRKSVVKSRVRDADHMHSFHPFLWRDKDDATLSEVIGRESWIEALDRDELIQQLLGEYEKPTLVFLLCDANIPFFVSLRFPTVIVCAYCRSVSFVKLMMGVRLHHLPRS